VEEDLKKVVALSTLSQIGFSIVTLGLGLRFISFIHLIRHALFKSCLFIQVGYIIHCSFGQQDGRNYSNNGNLPNFIQLQLLVTLFCLCGLIFSRGAVRKDFILEFFYYVSAEGIILRVLFFFGVFLTFLYRIRLGLSMVKIHRYRLNYIIKRELFIFLSFPLIIFSLFLLW